MSFKRDPSGDGRPILMVIPQNPSLTQKLALLVIALLTLGPLIAATVILLQNNGPATGVGLPEAGSSFDVNAEEPTVLVTATITGVDIDAGTLSLRLVPEFTVDVLNGGVLTETFEIRADGIEGDRLTVLQAGAPPKPTGATIALEGDNAARYPFERYSSTVAVAVVSPDSPDSPINVLLDVTSTVSTVVVKADGERVETPDGDLVAIRLSVERPLYAKVYVIGFMIVAWGLAIGGLGLAWSTVVWRQETPMWAFGFLIGALFALPPLRDALPGSPPPGTLVDFVALYWAIFVIALTLLLVLATHLRRSRASRHADLAEAKAATEQAAQDRPSP